MSPTDVNTTCIIHLLHIIIIKLLCILSNLTTLKLTTIWRVARLGPISTAGGILCIRVCIWLPALFTSQYDWFSGTVCGRHFEMHHKLNPFLFLAAGLAGWQWYLLYHLPD
jgi:hypothetical protein